MIRIAGWLCTAMCAALLGRAALANDVWVATRSMDTESLLESVQGASTASAELRVRALLTLSDRSINASLTDALDYLERAEYLIDERYTDAQLIAKALRCQLEFRQGLPASTQSCLELDQADFGDTSRFAAVYADTTRMYRLYKVGQHMESMELAQSIVSRAESFQDPALLAAAHNMIGLYFLTRLRPRMSLPHFEDALDYAALLPYPGQSGLTQVNLASAYTYLGRSAEALSILRQFVDSTMYELYGTRRLVIYSMIGQARAAARDTDGAAETLLQVIEEVDSTVSDDQMSFGYMALGDVHLAAGRPQQALDSFERVLDLTGKNLQDDLNFSRVRMMVVPYAAALREAGRPLESQRLLHRVISEFSESEPDQHLLDAYRELALTFSVLGDIDAATAASQARLRIESKLWDASFQYQFARLNASLETDRRRMELDRANERAASLADLADRETRLRQQTWLMVAMILAVIALLYSRLLQKRTADAQRLASSLLEEQVSERTRELEDEMSKRMAMEVERRELAERMVEGEKLRAMGQLTAGVAHDFNNLMTVVTLGANELQRKVARQQDPETANTLENIRSAADTGAKITRGLLSYVREQPMQPERVHLDEFFRESFLMFRNSLGERFTLKTFLVESQVMVDKGQLTTAVLNLLLNAKEAMSDGGEISIHLRSSGGFAFIQVQDNGSGMDEHALKHATDPFFTTKQNEEGSGLGLSMVFGFARQSHGDLSIDSVEGEGTTVTLALPLVASAEAVVDTAAPLQPQSVENCDVLVVEDRPQVLQAIGRSLTHMGAKVTPTRSVTEALDVVRRKGMPDLLVSDIVMPGNLDGLGLVKQLRNQAPDLPVVLMSGYTRHVDDRCAFLHKPFSVDEFKQAIDKALSQSTTPA